jgi:hypothetical protein
MHVTALMVRASSCSGLHGCATIMRKAVLLLLQQQLLLLVWRKRCCW